MANIEDCQIIELPRILDPRGSLTFIEQMDSIPFEIERVFYIYDVPTAESRGAHSHRELHQFLIPLSGSFDVEVHDGFSETSFHLNRPWQGLHIPPGIWASEKNFDPGTVCLVLASMKYSEADYIRDYEEFKNSVKK